MQSKALKIPQLAGLIQFGRIDRDVELLVELEGEKQVWEAKVRSLTSGEQNEALRDLIGYQDQGPLIYEAMYRREMLTRCVTSINGYEFKDREQAGNFFDQLQDQLTKYLYERCVDQIIKEQTSIILEAYVAEREGEAAETLQEVAEADIADPGDVLKNLSGGDSEQVTTESPSEDTTSS